MPHALLQQPLRWKFGKLLQHQQSVTPVFGVDGDDASLFCHLFKFIAGHFLFHLIASAISYSPTKRVFWQMGLVTLCTPDQ
jgi:hypothetical protein